jgi:hypothetical protein
MRSGTKSVNRIRVFGNERTKVSPEDLKKLRRFVVANGGPTPSARLLGMGTTTVGRLLDGEASRGAVERLLVQLHQMPDVMDLETVKEEC